MEVAVAGGGAAVKVPTVAFGGQRHRFAVELRTGETTIVSWKKLVKDSNSNKVNKPAPVPVPVLIPDAPSLPVLQLPHTALDSRIAPGPTAENDADDVPPASRFSAVIEKIERLYMGKNSDEEDLNDVPDDHEYDTEDSFIDDAELDEYFQVDNSAIKHDGFFVNRGLLERASNEPTVSPVQQPKKRRRKDSTAKGHGGSDDGNLPNKQMKVNKKPAGKPVSVLGKNFTATANFKDDILQNQINAPEFSGRKHSVDGQISMDQSLRVSNGEAIAVGKDIDKQKSGMDQPKNHGRKLKDGIKFHSASSQRSNEKGAHGHKSQSGRSLNSGEEMNQAVLRKEKSGICERSDIKVRENSFQTTKTSVMQRKEGSSVESKGSMLEKAIRELEKVVAESRPPSAEAADADNSAQSVKRRMPHEIKQKLAKVARLAATHGKISKELLNRLMSILGHLIQLRTLKRNLKAMVNMGLSAKQEKDARFRHIKKEVDEMVKIRIPLMKSKAIEQQAGANDDFQETNTKEKEVLKRRFSMDEALEDKICDLYDLYVDALEEDVGPHLKKLYSELVELWPKGYMDASGIKRAICRAKDRKKLLYSRHKDQEEKMKRKKLPTPKTQESIQAETSTIPQPQSVQEKLSTDLASKGLTSVNRQVPSTTTADAVAPRMNGPKNINRPKQENVKGSLCFSNPNNVRTEVVVKKKAKRKPESDLGETHTRHEKLTLGQGGDVRQKSSKRSTSPVQRPPISKPRAPFIPNLNHAAELND